MLLSSIMVTEQCLLQDAAVLSPPLLVFFLYKYVNVKTTENNFKFKSFFKKSFFLHIFRSIFILKWYLRVCCRKNNINYKITNNNQQKPDYFYLLLIFFNEEDNELMNSAVQQYLFNHDVSRITAVYLYWVENSLFWPFVDLSIRSFVHPSVQC